MPSPRLVAGAASFLLSVAFVPGWAGAATSPRWAVSTLSLYWLKPWPALFALWCFVRLDFDAAVHWLIVASLFSLGWRLGHFDRDYLVETMLKAVAVGVGVSGVVAVFQSFGWSPVYQIAPPAGLFLNKNMMGEAACLACVACCRYRYWCYAGCAALPLALSQSRAAWLAAVVALLVALPRRWSFAAAGAGLVVVAWLHPDTGSLVQRFIMWGEALQQLTVLGRGSYGQAMPYGFEAHLHNDWLQLVYELGVVGLVPLAVVLAVPTSFTAAVVVVASFGFPFQVPTSAALIAVIVGADLRHSIVGRRILLRQGLARAVARRLAGGAGDLFRPALR